MKLITMHLLIMLKFPVLAHFTDTQKRLLNELTNWQVNGSQPSLLTLKSLFFSLMFDFQTRTNIPELFSPSFINSLFHCPLESKFFCFVAISVWLSIGVPNCFYEEDIELDKLATKDFCMEEFFT